MRMVLVLIAALYFPVVAPEYLMEKGLIIVMIAFVIAVVFDIVYLIKKI